MSANKPVPDPVLRTLLELTALTTAAGREQHVIRWIENWLANRPSLTLTTDAAGNLLILHKDAATSPVLFTAHLDHPAFTIDSITDDHTAHLTFLGGVHPHYFDNARIVLYPANPGSALSPVTANITAREEPDPPTRLYRTCTAQSDEPLTGFITGDIATWDLPETTITDGILRARVCDDLAALAAAFDAIDALQQTDAAQRVGILCTRAEEVGFIGAIAACKLGTIPKDARVLALENSRSFPDSPLGAGPIVRVGDRLSTFSPTLNAAVARCAQTLAGAVESDVGRPNITDETSFKWQRKLMPGGACEATAYSAYGYEATCICLPLGNYHNMADLTEYENAIKQNQTPAANIDSEYISIDDYNGLVRLLIACGQNLEAAEPIIDRLEKLYTERKSVLDTN